LIPVMLHLDNVTLITIDGVDPDLSLKSLQYCCRGIKFNSVKLLSFKKPIAETGGIEFIKIEKLSWKDYNHFIIQKLNSFVYTAYCLLIQTDGFVIRPDLWNDAFFKYDFIGAPLSDYPVWLKSQPEEFQIKFKESNLSESRWPLNGGFSFRSKKMLEFSALCPYAVKDLPEDMYITLHYRDWFEQKQLTFAPRSLAYSFSKESPLTEGEFDFSKCFGFHGKISSKHLKLVKLLSTERSGFSGLKKILNIHPDISLKQYSKIKLKQVFRKSLSRNDFFNYYKEYYYEIKRTKANYDITIDLIITVVEKDFPVLPYAIECARKNILHTINNIYIIAPNHDLFRDFCSQHDCSFVSETEVLPLKKTDIKYNVNGTDGAGWLFQQIIKLHSDLISNSENIVCLDADTLLIRPSTYIDNRNKRILQFSDELHQPYFLAYEKLTGQKHTLPVSFVCHTMLFEAGKLKELRKHIEKHTKMKFTDAVISTIIDKEKSCFSEFETYANFVLSRYRKDYDFEYWFNNSRSRKEMEDLEYIVKIDQSCDYKSISFHDYTI
jgi:hypothetical protein